MARRVIVEVAEPGPLPTATLSLNAFTANALPTTTGTFVPAVAAAGLIGFEHDVSYPAIPVRPHTPGAVRDTLTRASDALAAAVVDATDATEATYLIRGEVATDADAQALLDQPGVRAVHSDPIIAHFLTCAGTPPVGSDADVARLLGTSVLRGKGMDGSGVFVAVVDTGINLPYLIQKRGKTPSTDPAKSWADPASGVVPFNAPLNHGTMCAFDILIGAPNATLIDLPVLATPATPGQPLMTGVLSDAVLAYSHLLDLLMAARQAGKPMSLVVSNSWGLFDPAWDFPAGDPKNYTDNPRHPFNRIVATLERFGADILFAAGNCGPECPDGRCRWPSGVSTIVGANSSPSVLCIAGVDVSGARVGYSSKGPGRLADTKPDVAGFTHFKGSGAFGASEPDSGTSAACPVVAGLIAAVRSKLPVTDAAGTGSPGALRKMLRETALDKGTPGFDYEYGYGIVNGPKLAAAVAALHQPDPVTAAAVSALAAELQGTAAPSRTAFSPAADVAGVKTFIAHVVTDAAMQSARMGVDAKQPKELIGNDTDRTAEFTTDSDGSVIWSLFLETVDANVGYRLFLTEKGKSDGDPEVDDQTGDDGTALKGDFKQF